MRTSLALCALGMGALIAGCSKDDAQIEATNPQAAITANQAESCDGCDKAGDMAMAAAIEGETCGGCDESGAKTAVAAKPAGEEGCGGCAESGAVAMTGHDPVMLTKGMQLEQFTPISQILAAPAAFEGKRVLVQGMAVAVCAKRGCWITLKSEAANDQALRVKVEDGEIVFPLTLKGHEVVAEGIVEKIVTPIEAVRELRQQQAESRGEAFDPASVTEPLVTWQLKGLGARWDS